MPHSTFRQRTGYFWPRVALASTLTDDICQEEDDGIHTLSLREEASYEGLTYIQVLKRLDNSDLYLARVAFHPNLLPESDLLVFFTEEQLIYTLPYDIRLQEKFPKDIIRAIKAHAATLQPARAVVVQTQQTTISETTALALHPLSETIEVTKDDLTAAMNTIVAEQQEATHTSHTSPTKAAHLLQQVLLRAALDVLMRQLWETPNQARSLVAQARVKLLTVLQRWQEKTLQRVVMAKAVWNQVLGEAVWVLTVGVPVQLG